MGLVTVTYPSDETYSSYSVDFEDSVFGGPSDLWGASLTADILNDPSFAITFGADFPSGTVLVDEVKVEVFYELNFGDGGEGATGNPDVYRPPSTPILDGNGVPTGEYAPIVSALKACAVGAPAGQVIIVLVGYRGLIKRSADRGATWSVVNSGVISNLWDVAATDTGFITCGDNGVVLESSDGETWTQQEPVTTAALYAVHGKGNKVVAGKNMYRKTNAWKNVRA